MKHRGTMVATVYDEYGPPEVLHTAELPRPEPGPGEVLVKISACAVNGFDLMARAGSYRPNPGFPHILGGDICGVVERYGPGCDQRLAPGTAVLIYWIRSCGGCDPCLRGHPTTCLEYQYLGAHLPGGYAQYIAVPEHDLLPLPDGIDRTTAAAFPIAFGTSWHMLVTKAELRPGETVLVQGVGSGIGMAAVQICRLVGAKVIGTAGSAEKLAKGRDLGVEHGINYRDTDVRAAVMDITGKRGVDVVFEHVGGEGWDGLIRSATRNGRIITCGGTAGYEVTMNLAHVFHKELRIIGATGVTRREFHQTVPFLVDGTFTPVVDRVFPLEDAAAAHKHVEAREQFGKVVLSVDA